MRRFSAAPSLHEAHALQRCASVLLVGAEGLTQRLPRISELFEFGAPLGQVIGAFTQQFHRINIGSLPTQLFS